MSAATPVTVVTGRDRLIVRACWSLGWVTRDQLAALVAPRTLPETLSRRLTQLVRSGYLAQRRIPGSAGHLWIYTLGPRAWKLDPNYAEAWRPALLQLDHTLAVNDAIIALIRPGRVAPLTVTGWQGEVELRGWTQPGRPIPDGRITWAHDGLPGGWLLEIDRGSESRHHWRRKLARYLAHPARARSSSSPERTTGRATLLPARRISAHRCSPRPQALSAATTRSRCTTRWPVPSGRSASHRISCGRGSGGHRAH